MTLLTFLCSKTSLIKLTSIELSSWLKLSINSSQDEHYINCRTLAAAAAAVKASAEMYMLCTVCFDLLPNSFSVLFFQPVFAAGMKGGGDRNRSRDWIINGSRSTAEQVEVVAFYYYYYWLYFFF